MSGIELVNVQADTSKLLKNISQKRYISFYIDVVVVSQVFATGFFVDFKCMLIIL